MEKWISLKFDDIRGRVFFEDCMDISAFLFLHPNIENYQIFYGLKNDKNPKIIKRKEFYKDLAEEIANN